MYRCVYSIMIVTLLFILTGAVLFQESATRNCNTTTELPCDDGQCIPYQQWCDKEYDCSDGSDENYCFGADQCLPSHFQCGNGICIPTVATCNGQDNCGDGSDEFCGGTESVLSDEEAVIGAANFILSKRDSDYGWGSFTPRAIIALTLAEKVWPFLEKENILMKKRLDVQILLNLKQKGTKYNLIELAFFVNALYALCENPRNFNGIDLVGLLRSETDIAMRSNFSLPVVLMTLCLAKEAKPNDFRILASMFDSHNDKGFRALTVMAMSACIVSRDIPSDAKRSLLNRMSDFLNDVTRQYRRFDVYSTALINQALNSLKYNDVMRFRQDLLNHRRADGSFGDLLATYYSIPVLMNTSLLNLKCKERQYEEMLLGNSLPKGHLEKKIVYSLRITNGVEAASHTMFLTVEGNKTFYDVMKLAEKRDSRFRFSFEETAKGKQVYTLGGLPNDAETCMHWTLFRGESDRVSLNSKGSLKLETNGIDRIYPENGNHFIFWMKRTPN